MSLNMGLNLEDATQVQLIVHYAELHNVMKTCSELGIPDVEEIKLRYEEVGRRVNESMRQEKQHRLRKLKLQHEGLKSPADKRREVERQIAHLEKELA